MIISECIQLLVSAQTDLQECIVINKFRRDFEFSRMKGEYDDLEDNDDCQYIGLGAGRKNKTSKNQQIYGDFYQAYQQQPQTRTYTPRHNSYGDAFNRFKPGSKIQNYAAQCDVHIPEPKKKVKLQQSEQPVQQPQIGQFNLQSFLRDFQQKEQLQKIEEEDEQEEYNGPFCLNSKVKRSLKLVKLGEQDDCSDIDDGEVNINEMTFEQYRKLVMRNGKKDQAKESRKKLTAEEKQKEREFVESYGKGYSMLEKMGFNLSKGLGKEEKGITKPVQAVFKTAFTTKDSELREEELKEEQAQTQQEQIAAEQALFHFRSRNIRLNNFLLDLKNKYESLTSKVYFYEKEVQQVDREFQINDSLKLQKRNQLEEHQQEITKLTDVREYGRARYDQGIRNDNPNTHTHNSNNYGHNSNNYGHNSNNYGHNQELNPKHIHPHLSLHYKLDMLYIKNEYMRLKSMPDQTLFQSFPIAARNMHNYLTHFYRQKQRQTLKQYQEGARNFKNRQMNVINLEEDVIDLVEEKLTQAQSVVAVSVDDQAKIAKIIEVLAQNTLISKANAIFSNYTHLNQINNFKLLECLKVLKELNLNSQLVHNFATLKIKPLVLNYYRDFDCEQHPLHKKQSKQTKPQLLPHMLLFPLFEIMDPAQLELGKLLKALASKLWNLHTPTLFNTLKPLLPYCPLDQKSYFLHFYLAPRLLHYLEEFDLTQPHTCKQLMSTFKLHKELLTHELLKDLLNCTIIPEIVMTYRKYEQEGTTKQDLKQWGERWCKEIGKIVPNYLEQVMLNDFNIDI